MINFYYANMLDMEWLTTAVLTVIGLFGMFVFVAECEEYCSTEYFTANCSDSNVILVQSAKYGRMYAKRCLIIESPSDEDTLGCFGSVLQQLDERCTGRSVCRTQVHSLDDYVPYCYKGSRYRFLEATYSCIEIQDDTNCSTIETSTNGYLRGPWVSDTFGKEQCTWKLTTIPGQHFQIDLIDISLKTAWKSVQNDGNKACPIFLGVIDNDKDGNINKVYLCYETSQLTRSVTVHTTVGNEIELYVHTDISLSPYEKKVDYLLFFQVIGCPDIAAPPNIWTVREGSRLTAKCNKTKETWVMVCYNNKWVGTLGNCSNIVETSTQKLQNDSDNGFPWGIVTAVAVGIAIGVFVGLSLLGVVILLLRCRDKKNKTPRASSSDLSKIDVPYTIQQRSSLYDTQPGPSSNYGSHTAVNSIYGQSHLERSASYHTSMHQPHPSNITRAASYHYHSGQKRPLPNPNDPPYQVYGYNVKKGKGKSLEKQNTTTTDADEHIYETAYMTRLQALGQSADDKEQRQKSLAKEYYEMRGTPEGTLEKQEFEEVISQ